MHRGIEHIFKEGSIWDEKEFFILENYILDEYDLKNKCKHTKNNILKYIVKGINEGGHNSTGICGECIIEALESIRNK